MDVPEKINYLLDRMEFRSGGAQAPNGRSLRDLEEQMTALRKENFNLKLRIYFLEEKNSGSVADADTVLRQNVDLKVENESFRNELQEKQDLLVQAANAMTLMEESQRVADVKSQSIINELTQRLEMMETEMQIAADQERCLGDSCQVDFQHRIQNLEDDLAHLRLQNEELKAQLVEKEDQDVKLLLLEQQLGELKFEKAELKSLLDEKDEAISALERSYKTLKNFLVGKSDQIFAIITENGEMRTKIERLQAELAKEQADGVDMHRLKRKLLDDQREQMLLMQKLHVSRLMRMGGDFIRLAGRVKRVLLAMVFRQLEPVTIANKQQQISQYQSKVEDLQRRVEHGPGQSRPVLTFSRPENSDILLPSNNSEMCSKRNTGGGNIVENNLATSGPMTNPNEVVPLRVKRFKEFLNCMEDL